MFHRSSPLFLTYKFFILDVRAHNAKCKHFALWAFVLSMNEPNIIRVNANTLELHYWFVDESHSIDANVHNKCEFELLAIIKDIANTYSVEIQIETEPLAEGGLKRWFKIISKSEKKSAAISTAIIVAIITSILVTPLSTSIGKLTEKLIDRIFEDGSLRDIQNEKLKLDEHDCS